MTESTDDAVRRVLAGTPTVAVVGFLANPSRPSHSVAAFLRGRGCRVIPVNPGLAGQAFGGEVAVGSLAEVAGRIDIVDVFRRAPDIGAVVDAALSLDPLPGCIWMQLGLRHPEAAARARARGVTVIEDRCPAIEAPRLGL